MNKTIETFFEVHTNDPTSLPTQWEALKFVLRGTLIKHGARLKRERSFKFERLLTRIHDLEVARKRSQSPHTYANLVQTREQLRSLLDQSYTRCRDKTRRFFYESANKCGRPLARSLHPRSTTTYIQKLHSPNGPDVYDPQTISHRFQQYYSGLYNIRGPFHDVPPESLSTKIQAYIEETALPTLSPEETSSLEEDFSIEEVTRAIRNFPLGKSPGPDGFNNKFYKTFMDLLSPFFMQGL